MSVYRKGTTGSYTYRKKKARLEKNEWFSTNEVNHLLMYKNLDQFMDYKYTADIKKGLRNRHQFVLENIGNLDFLDLKPTKKTCLRLSAILSVFFPQRIRQNILGKVMQGIDY
jgi:hypothetical protein